MIPRYRAWYVLAEEMINEILMISFVRKEIIGKFSDGSTSVPGLAKERHLRAAERDLLRKKVKQLKKELEDDGRVKAKS